MDLLLWRLLLLNLRSLLLYYRLRFGLLLDDSFAQNSNLRGKFLVLKLQHVSLSLSSNQILLLLVNLNLILVVLVDLAVDVEVLSCLLDSLVNLLNVRGTLDSFFNDSVVVPELRDLPLPFFENSLEGLSCQLIVLDLVLELLGLLPQRLVSLSLDLVFLLDLCQRELGLKHDLLNLRLFLLGLKQLNFSNPMRLLLIRVSSDKSILLSLRLSRCVFC